jgi:flagellar hook-length control protein FliK
MEPAELGTVIVNITREAGAMTASLTASNENVQQALHETHGELAASLTSRTHQAVKVEVISAESTSMNSSTDTRQDSHSGSRAFSHGTAKASNRFEPLEVVEKAVIRERFKTPAIDLEI